MLGAVARRLFGSANDRAIKALRKSVDAINALEPAMAALPDSELRAQTQKFRDRLAKGEALDDLLPEAFATVRETAKRTIGQRPFDVQLMGAMILHQGKISEMKTGEGKTLVATMPVYLNALTGKGVHVVTVNDYLARRDAEWMGAIYGFLGLSVGVIVHGLTDDERRAAYGCDITYGTNNEFGFDYLRDNMKFRLEDMAQRDFNFAIVDEVDSILIDEARTPLIISGPAEDSSEMYKRIDALVRTVEPKHFEKDEKQRTVNFTEEGTGHIEQLLRDAGLLTEGDLYDPHNVTLVHHSSQALRAHQLFKRDTDYIVKDGKVIIIDEFTGRMMEGRRYSDGLHQALEAKEQVDVQQENQTLASITFQNFFRLYPKLAGMTGTAMTEANEFMEIYKLDVAEIPTNVQVQRKDQDDEVYRTAREKWEAIIMLIEECRARRQPVLVGTVSIEKSEHLSELLKKKRVPHQVLNARYHEQEALIISQAGAPGAITIATNMAGRGTDIQLGGNLAMRVKLELPDMPEGPERTRRAQLIAEEIEVAREEVRKSGGLYVIGTERHESRRIDNQLRGRSGRQGDPGGSKFFLSLEDDLMRIFGSERMDGLLQRLGLKEGEAIVHSWINKALEKAQQKVEARNFEIRKQLLRYDDVMNDQRKVIYGQRKEYMRTATVQEDVQHMRAQVIEDLVAKCMPEQAYAEQWDLDTLERETKRLFGIDFPVRDWAREEGIADQEVKSRIVDAVDRKMAEKAANYGPEIMRLAEKSLLLQILDQAWKDHLLHLDHLRQGINLRAYGQRDPLNEYKREAFALFEEMLDRLRDSVTQVLSNLEIRMSEPEQALPRRALGPMQESHAEPSFGYASDEDAPPAAGADGGAGPRQSGNGTARTLRNATADPSDPSTWGKVSRNAACPCGSGKKYKHCHGAVG